MMVCRECLRRYVEMCGRDEMVPRCVSPDCNGLYFRSACVGFESVYEMALYRGLLRDPGVGEMTRAREARQVLLQQIVNDRRKFLTTHFPLAIRRAVELLYDGELRKVESAQRRAVETSAASTRGCFRTFCGGVMVLRRGEQDRWHCGRCDTPFCAVCEERMDVGGAGTHTCRADEVASVQWKKALPSCPRCHQPIEKSMGCRFVTCAVCQQNFDYQTGMASAAGNHGQSVPVSVHHRQGVVRLYEKLLRGRPAAQLTPSESGVYKRLQELESSYDPDRPVVQWSAAQVLPSRNLTRDEASQARLVASRVERLELQRQESRRLVMVLRDLDDEIDRLIPQEG